MTQLLTSAVGRKLQSGVKFDTLRVPSRDAGEARGPRGTLVFEALTPDPLFARPLGAASLADALSALESTKSITRTEANAAASRRTPLSVAHPLWVTPARRSAPASRLVPGSAPHRPVALPPGPALAALAAMVAPPVCVEAPPATPARQPSWMAKITSAPAHLVSLVGVLAAGIAIGHCFF